MPRNEDVERVAETHFIRPQLVRALEHTTLTDDARTRLGRPYRTYLEAHDGIVICVDLVDDQVGTYRAQ